MKKGLEAQNEKYRKRRQYGYIRSIDDLMESEKTQVKEMILQIGNKRPYIRYSNTQ